MEGYCFFLLWLVSKAQCKSQNKKRTWAMCHILGGFQVLSLGHSAEAKIKNVEGYLSYFGSFPGPKPIGQCAGAKIRNVWDYGGFRALLGSGKESQ